MNILTKLKKLTDEKGLQVVDCGNGHLQIRGGALLVNYWPESKRRSAYVAGTTKKYSNVQPERVIELATTPPPIAGESRKDERKGSYRRRKIKMLRRQRNCRWCGCSLSIDGKIPGTVKATLEHVIPLDRGGLDNPNNHALACEPCNSSRGNNMPEIAQEEL